MTPLLDHARRLVDGTELDGVWARAAAHLVRQALEAAIDEAISRRGARSQNFTARLVCLREVADRELVTRAAWTWSALSEATHLHAYELPPTRAELLGWIDTVADVVEHLR